MDDQAALAAIGAAADLIHGVRKPTEPEDGASAGSGRQDAA